MGPDTHDVVADDIVAEADFAFALPPQLNLAKAASIKKDNSIGI